jgi:hypothetical protein
MNRVLKMRSAMRANTQINDPVKIADTETLARLNAISIAKDYNRNLSDLFFKRIDPNGTHVLSILMVHEHAQLQTVAPHFRCMVLAKMRHQMKPAFVILDLPMTAFHSLEDGVRRTSQARKRA